MNLSSFSPSMLLGFRHPGTTLSVPPEVANLGAPPGQTAGFGAAKTAAPAGMELAAGAKPVVPQTMGDKFQGLMKDDKFTGALSGIAKALQGGEQQAAPAPQVQAPSSAGPAVDAQKSQQMAMAGPMLLKLLEQQHAQGGNIGLRPMGMSLGGIGGYGGGY